ncbi:hypothetical protein [Streptomyces zhihengii]|uniref:hypothetical protein n=1 Tax=Streptomyces zhihengii TaxID=1818004 RepID=UPI0033A4CB04
MIWGVLGLCHRPLHRLEDSLPDATPDAEVESDLNVVQERVDRRFAATRRKEPAGGPAHRPLA